MAGLHIKKCFILLERVDEKSLKKCLQKHGLKLSPQSCAERPMTDNRNKRETPTIITKQTKRNREKRNSGDFTLEWDRKRKRRKIRPLSYTDDESDNDSGEIPTKLSMGFKLEDDSVSSNELYKDRVKPEPAADCDKMSATAEGTTVSEFEVRKELVKGEGKSDSQLKNDVHPQHADVCCGRTDKHEVLSTVDIDIEIFKMCEETCDKKQSATSLNNMKQELIADTESREQRECDEDGYDSRDDGEDERNTVIFGEELHKDTDLEDITEFEGKEISKKFNNREITNRKRQRMVKFKRKSMAGRNLAKIERKLKNKILEGSGSGQETPEKPSECVSEECLKEVCGLVKRLHELSKIISLLQRELPKNEEMSIHFNTVINAQQENFHREIRKGQKTIIKCYEKMLSFYSETRQVALEIGKRTSLSVEDVVNVISLCILIEGRCEADVSRNAGKQVFPTATSPNALQKIISDNFMILLMKKISQMEALSSSPKQPRSQNKVSNSFAFSSPQSNPQKDQTVNHSGSVPSPQIKHQKNTNFLQSQQTVDNFTFPHSQPQNVAKQKLSDSTDFPPLRCNIPSRQQNVTKSSVPLFPRPNSQQTVNNSIGFPNSRRDNQQKMKKVNSTGVSHLRTDTQRSQQTRNNSIPSLLSQIILPPIQVPFSQSITQQTVTSTVFQSNIHKMANELHSQANKQITSCSPSKQKKKNQWENFSASPKRQMVKNPTGSRPNNPRDVNHPPSFRNRSWERPFKPLAREKTVYSADGRMISVRVTEERRSNHLILERHRPSNRTLQNCILSPRLGQQVFNQTNLRPLCRPQRLTWNQPPASGCVEYRGVPTTVVRLRQAPTHRFNHTVFPQWNIPSVSSANMETPVPGLNRPRNTPLENNRNPTARVAGDLQSRECHVTTSHGPVPSTEEIMPPGAADCPLNNANFMVFFAMDNGKLPKTHVELGARNCNGTVTVENSDNGVEQTVLDPTIPQKLTMKNSRLQAGPVLDLETDGAQIREKSISPSTETKKACGESGKPDWEKSQSRVYFCAKDDCTNTGDRICNGCHSIIYCSATCQFKHWIQKHKSECYQLRALRD